MHSAALSVVKIVGNFFLNSTLSFSTVDLPISSLSSHSFFYRCLSYCPIVIHAIRSALPSAAWFVCCLSFVYHLELIDSVLTAYSIRLTEMFSLISVVEPPESLDVTNYCFRKHSRKNFHHTLKFSAYHTLFSSTTRHICNLVSHWTAEMWRVACTCSD